MNKKRVYLGGFAFSLLLVLLAVSVFTFRYMKGFSLQQLKAAIESLGGMASVVFIVMCTARGLVFIPCGVLSALGGLLFGPLMGTAFTLIGLTAGAAITFYLARSLGKSWAERTLGHKYDRYEGYISKDSFYSIFLMRVVPILPFDVVSIIAGMSRARADKYILATLVGSLPGIFVYVFFGDSVRSLSVRRVAFSAAFIAVFALMPFFYKYLMKLIKKIA
ncbi:MAG TPA: TVP38/TMEM64 family protein [Clostridia bacterium]|nr:TVP38/TMEM64 family protein [Clostridia bacterium]